MTKGISMLRRRVAVTALAAVVLASGCASVQMAPEQADTAAKSYAVSPGTANIYVYRNEQMGAAIKMPVVLNGKLVGDTGAKTYLLLQVPPGPHVIVSKTENDSLIAVSAEAGRNYFVWQEVKMGVMSPRSLLHLVDEATGKAGVAECKLAQTLP
ncbi:MAG TPA: DUF2846 domain-containing protein [Burkholderiales bacterium]|nr:DUF2846 domain-containing protein [Burkholderiales bacterium]